jgi:hypothetical protein
VQTRQGGFETSKVVSGSLTKLLWKFASCGMMWHIGLGSMIEKKFI